MLIFNCIHFYTRRRDVNVMMEHLTVITRLHCLNKALAVLRVHRRNESAVGSDMSSREQQAPATPPRASSLKGHQKQNRRSKREHQKIVPPPAAKSLGTPLIIESQIVFLTGFAPRIKFRIGSSSCPQNFTAAKLGFLYPRSMSESGRVSFPRLLLLVQLTCASDLHRNNYWKIPVRKNLSRSPSSLF